MILFVIIFVVLCIVGLLYGNTFMSEYNNVLIIGVSLGASLVITVVSRFVLGKFGSTSGSLYGGRKANWSIREQLSANLSQAKHLKGKNDFNKAIITINQALKQDPNWPEALFIKAQIVWEGFENAHAAKKYLKKVIKSTTEEDELNEQAMELFKTLETYEKVQKSTT